MTDEEIKEPTPDEMLDEAAKVAAMPVPMTPQQEAGNRAAACRAAIQDALAHFQCSVVTVGIIRQVGSGPMTEWLTHTDYGVQPNPLE